MSHISGEIILNLAKTEGVTETESARLRTLASFVKVDGECKRFVAFEVAYMIYKILRENR